jgi:glycogen debranching enzyme
MRRRSVLGGLAIGAAGVSSVAKAAPRGPSVMHATPVLDSLAIPVTSAQNRQYSYTDKVSGYFHGRTHMDDNSDWFNGWNIATKRIFHDYALSVDAAPLVRAKATVVVSPHKLMRRFEGATETLSLLDTMAVLVLSLTAVRGDVMGLAFKGDLTDAGTLGPEGVWFAPKEATGSHLLVAPINVQTVRVDPIQGVVVPKAATGFYLIHAATKPAARALLSRARRGASAMLAARASRMEALVSGNHALDAGDADRTKALLWMRLTTDQLVMKQMGTGIYAGLPWFNDYWGRDTFISITGALFVSGQYDIAADVFRSFAALQDVDPASKTYGRVPNRARPDGIEYNSADGTPRFIITLADLVNRSGNVALARELWPAVKRAVEGVLANNVDELGLITHEDADTWMDAKEKGTRAWSPRGNRAVDVQALWIRAFGAVQRLSAATHVSEGERVFGRKCQTAHRALAAALNQHFIDPVTGNLVDHLKVDGRKDTKLRPNAFFALSVMNQSQKYDWIKQLWEGLVYPWGVGTLSQNDPDFYPYHEHWHYYHKDASYHNGTVWPWLNGVAMDALLDYGVVDQPWQLFENMNRQALEEGAVGSLAECADALPRPSAMWTRRTGTFLQAWSNAEHLRIWHEKLLGLTSSLQGTMKIKPCLPKSILNVTASVPFGAGQLIGKWHDGGTNRWSFQAIDTKVRIYFELPELNFPNDYLLFSWELRSGERLEIEKIGTGLTVKVLDENNVTIKNQIVDPPEFTHFGVPNLSPQSRLATHQARALFFADIDFCKPHLQPNLKSLSVRHDPPLTY